MTSCDNLATSPVAKHLLSAHDINLWAY